MKFTRRRSRIKKLWTRRSSIEPSESVTKKIMMKFLVLRATKPVSEGFRLNSIVTAKKSHVFTAIDIHHPLVGAQTLRAAWVRGIQ